MSQPFLFDIPQSIEDYLVVLDDFIEREIRPLEAQDDNIRFFDHRREHARGREQRRVRPRVQRALGESRGPSRAHPKR